MTQKHLPRAKAPEPNKYKINTPHNTPSFYLSDFYLGIISYLEAGISPAKIAAKLGVSKQAFQYHLNKLIKHGIIRKVGYGTWEVLEPLTTSKKRSKNISHVDQVNTPPQVKKEVKILTQSQLTRFQQDAVRAHAFVLTLQVPKNMRNWNNTKRTQYLTAHQIPFKPLGIGGGGQRIIVKEKKVWLLNRSIVIYDRSSYFAEAALQAKSTAIATHLSSIKHIERLLHVSFQIGSDYKFRVSRQHYALIQNALAKQYNESGEKLEIRNGRGLWFLIDNSYNMNEAETVHPSSAMSDNKKVQDWFNGLKEQPITPAFVLEAMAGIQANQMAFAENMASHITAVQDLGAGVRDMTEILRQLKRGQ